MRAALNALFGDMMIRLEEVNGLVVMSRDTGSSSEERVLDLIFPTSAMVTKGI